MPVTIHSPSSADELTEFLLFQDRVNERREAWWPAIVPANLPMLQGDGPAAVGRRFLPLVARRGDEIVARVLGVVDQRYIDHWGEALGHVSMFEALPDMRDAVGPMLDEACAWLREQGMEAARAGFGVGDFPFVLDAYGDLPPALLRQNPPRYHALLKDAGFETEKGWVDYRIRIDGDILSRWARFVEDAQRTGFDVKPLKDIPSADRIPHFMEVWNEAFSRHWGVVPLDAQEFSGLLSFLEPMGMLDTTVIAYSDGTPVGAVWCVPETASALARTAPGRVLGEHESVNFLAIGVRERARGRGVNLAMAASSYLELARRGAGYVSYTLVLDDNWPSRRTAERLGATVCANYLVYRRNFKRV